MSHATAWAHFIYKLTGIQIGSVERIWGVQERKYTEGLNRGTGGLDKWHIFVIEGRKLINTINSLGFDKEFTNKCLYPLDMNEEQGFQRAQENELNDSTGKTLVSKSKSVEHYDGPISLEQKIHGACHPLSLVLQQIEVCTEREETAFDPFMGVSTTAEATGKLEKRND